MSSTLPISKMAWLDSLLNTIFSFARSSRILILFDPILILSMSSVFVWTRSSFTVRRVSSFASEVGSTSCLVALPSVACFVSSRSIARLSQVARCFQTFWVSSSSLGCCGCCCCCCCCICKYVFNMTVGGGFGVASLSKSTRSPFWEVTRSTQSFGIVV